MNQPSRLPLLLSGLWLLPCCAKSDPVRELSLELPETIISKDPVVAQARVTYQDGTREQLRGEQPFQLTPNDLAKLGKQGAVSCARSGEGTLTLLVAGVTGRAKVSCKLVASLELPDKLRIDVSAGDFDPKLKVLDQAGRELELPVSLNSDKGGVVQARGGLLSPMRVGSAKLTARAGQVVKTVDVEVVRSLRPELLPVDQNRRIHFTLEAGKYQLSLVLPSAHPVSIAWLGAPYCAYKGHGAAHVSTCTLQSKGGVSFDNPAFLSTGQKTPSLEGVTLYEVP